MGRWYVVLAFCRVGRINYHYVVNLNLGVLRDLSVRT